MPLNIIGFFIYKTESNIESDFQAIDASAFEV